mmetsp:Transcript_30326/g.54920  ORF Transcript_30326/g.54920 Transcript_30326/m.54920 type:complete len:230 (+) Transcript_30326:62-751(+)
MRDPFFSIHKLQSNYSVFWRFSFLLFFFFLSKPTIQSDTSSSTTLLSTLWRFLLDLANLLTNLSTSSVALPLAFDPSPFLSSLASSSLFPLPSPNALGWTKSSSLVLRFSSLFSLLATCFSTNFFDFLSRSDKKYSPESSCKSIFEGSCAGGKGVYDFFFLGATLLAPSPADAAAEEAAAIFCCSSTNCLGFLLCTFFFLNVGKNLSQLSSLSFGSFSNSLIIMSRLML